MTARLTDHEWTIATTICTRLQLEALDYWRHGYGYKRISIILGIPRDTARGRIERALDNIRRQPLQSEPAKPRTHETRTHPPRP